MSEVDDTVEYVGRKDLGCRKGFAPDSIAISSIKPSTSCNMPVKPTTIDSNLRLMHRCLDCKVSFYAINKPKAKQLLKFLEDEEPAVLPPLKKSAMQ